MALRWYSTVVDCHDLAAQARWWADAIGWTLIFESEHEAVLVPSYVTPALVADTPWDRIGPGLVFVSVPEGKTVKNRLHIDLAPHTSDDRDAEIERLLAMGATRADVQQPPDASWDVLLDPEGNEFCVLSSRDR